MTATGKTTGVLTGSGLQAVAGTVCPMNETEFATLLKRHGLSARKACVLLYQRAEVVVDPRDVDKTLRLKGRFSVRETGMWRLSLIHI